MKITTTRVFDENAEAVNIGDIKHGREMGRGGSPSEESQSFIYHACEKCGRERWIRYKVKTKTPVNIVCNSCRSKERKGSCNSNWRGGKVNGICLECNNTFSRPRAWMKKSGKFCSNRCEMIHQRKSGIFSIKPNLPEKQIISVLEQNKFPFRYVGNGEVWLGNRNPDFINTNGKKQVIELLGIYWHPIFDVAQRIEHYKQYGFDCLIMWEDELINVDKVIMKIKKFSRNAHEVNSCI